MISKILVPTDGSETARKSVEYAAELAKQIGADMTLLSVIDKSFLISKSMPGLSTKTRLAQPIEDYLKEAAEAIVEQAKRMCRKKGIEVKQAIRYGHPVEEIIKEAKKTKSDLIVMGSHGRSALKASLLGSVTFGVIHKDTNIPVLVVRR
jgi:nucleotide-binding universal stress UspA family protein